ncbi:ROK family protein [Bacillus marinisedimentorum]|uniref:ROK family protein n=1 Tax=Bacillus marinisedimentorum TaxID=1821260 RepID=UPI000AD496B6|nr:ROK family protein [Bacillus marinisedimentorum]
MMKNKLSIGVDIGGTNVRAALVDEKGTIIKEVNRKTESSKGPDFILDKIADMIREVKQAHPITGIGIGSPGPLDPFSGIILDPPNLPALHNTEITSIFEKEFAVPVILDNDANAAALAEAKAGAGQGHDSVVYITVSTGIGAGIVLDGKVVRGAQGNAGEIGNMIVLPGGLKQSNLNAGSLEAMSSGTAIAREGKNRLGLTGGAEEVFELARQGNNQATEIIGEAMNYLSIGIANVMHTVNPDIFVLGGGVMEQKDMVLPMVREQTAEYLYASMQVDLKIEHAALGTKAGVIGAGLLVFEGI